MKNITHYFMLLLGTPLVWCYLRFIQISSKITISGEELPNQLKVDNLGHLFVFWHNRQFILPLLRPQDTIHCLISDSRDGDYMSTLCKLFGKQPIRGSSSRNGLRAMKQIMRLLKAGSAVAIATDGPRGPVFEVKPGIVQMSQVIKVPIIPVSFDASNKKVLTSWDSSYLLFPFGKIAIVFGEPINIDLGQSINAACEQVRVGLVKAGEKATLLLTDL